MRTNTIHGGKLHLIIEEPTQQKAYIVILDENTNELAVAETLKECSDAVQEYISKYNLGASTFYGGTILHPTKGAFAHVGYNGRVWDGLTYVPNGKEYKGEELLKTLN